MWRPYGRESLPARISQKAASVVRPGDGRGDSPSQCETSSFKKRHCRLAARGAPEAAPTRLGSMVDLLTPSPAAFMIGPLRQTPGSATREETRMKIDGRCHCGEITFEAEVDPDALNICHCTDCQTLSGSAFRVNIPAPGEHFVLHGTPKTYIKTAESGNKRLHASAVPAARQSMLVRWIIRRAMACESVRSLSAPASHRGGRAGGGRRCVGSTRLPPSRWSRTVEEHIQIGPMRLSWQAPRPRRMLRSLVSRFKCG